MKYFKVAVFTMLLIVSGGTGSDVLGIPNPLTLYDKLQNALEKIRVLEKEKVKLERELKAVTEKYNEADEYRIRVIPILNGATKMISGQAKRIKDLKTAKRQLEESNDILQAKVEVLVIAANSRLEKFWSMYEPSKAQP